MGYPRNAWYVAAWSCDLSQSKPFAITILDEPIVLFRGGDNKVVGLEDRCVHRLAPLSLGRCEGNRLRCMYHGLLFDADGRVVEIPGQDVIPPQARVRSYAVADRHDWIWVWMGEAADADESLIPPAVGISQPDWVLGHGHMDYAAEARLICDNLCDFSHLTYAHAESFGASDTWATNRPKITPLERGIRVERWLIGQKPLRARSDEVEVDTWSTYDFLLPGVLLLTGGTYPAGTAVASNMGPPDPYLSADGVTFTSQAVTPLAGNTARYFFSWGPRADQGGETLRDTLMAMALQAFTEDRVMIEAQQRVIDATQDVRIMPTSADKGVTLYNRLVERFSKAEEAEVKSASIARMART